MSTYNLNIDTVNTSLDYYQAEKRIYGSSRLGMLKDSVNVLGSAYGNTDSLNVTHKLGNKRYELSNHLGNVLAVLTDKPIPHNNGGTVDYWEANISSAYDYSPFGVMLTGRTFEGKQTVCRDSTVQATQNALEEGFGSWGSWTADGNGAITYVADEMQISNPSSSKKNIGAHKDFNTGTGLHSVSFKVMGNVCANVVYWPPSSTPIPIKVSVKDNLGNTVTTGNYTSAGTYSLSFTPASASLTYRIEFYMTNASAFCFFRVDDVLISFDDTTTLTVCKEVEDGYRYGFNSMEKDDEVKGRGNSYDFGARMYDSRLGRWLTIDPLAGKYPGSTPYAFSLNTPIIGHDPDGKKIIVGSEEALEVIRMTLSPEEASYVKMNKNGKINKRSLKKGLRKIGVKNIGSNYSSLLTIVKEKEVVEVFLSQTYETTNNGTKTLSTFVSDDYRDTWELAYRGAADATGNIEIDGKEYDFEGFKKYYDENKLGNGVYVSGVQGITAVPGRLITTDFDKKGEEKSLKGGGDSFGQDGNIVVTVNEKSARTNMSMGAKTMAHELFGHAYMAITGKPFGHGPKRNVDNQELENRIKNSVNEAEQNYEKHKGQ